MAQDNDESLPIWRSRGPTSSASVSVSHVRGRAPTACQICRQRKVKCNVTTVGIPCLNCAHHGHYCQIYERQSSSSRQQTQRDGMVTGRDGTGVPSTSLRGNPPRSSSAGSQRANSTPTSISLASSATAIFAPPSDMRYGVGFETVIEADASTSMDCDSAVRGCGRDESAIECLVLSNSDDTAESRTGISNVGEQQDIGYILDIEGGQNVIAQHYRLPYTTIPHDLMPQNMAYLGSEAVFSVPSKTVCEALLIAYFHHIHPILPVVDAAVVLTAFWNSGASAVNLLLLWSMFSVAANHIDKEMVRQAGYQSRKEMKNAMFTRAKCVYDSGSERDRITIIQSVSLLAFWSSDSSECTESWHWMGIAIGLSQTLGLHRDPDRGQYNMRLSDRQRQLWRRIWWSCFFRDRWLSLAMSRPVRINARDCDTPMPSVEDLTNDFTELHVPIRVKYISPDFRQLANHWVALLHLSKALGEILSKNYSLTDPLSFRTWIEATEKELKYCITLVGEYHAQASPILSFYSCHLRLHFDAATIALWRPRTRRLGPDAASDSKDTWFDLVHQKIRTAATNMNTVLHKIISDRLIDYMGPMTIPLLLPAMHSHLLESKSTDPLIRHSSLNKLNLFMMVMKYLEDVHAPATFIHKLFLIAISKVTSPQFSKANKTEHLSPQHNSADGSTGHTALEVSMENLWQFDDQI